MTQKYFTCLIIPVFSVPIPVEAHLYVDVCNNVFGKPVSVAVHLFPNKFDLMEVDLRMLSLSVTAAYICSKNQEVG